MERRQRRHRPPFRQNGGLAKLPFEEYDLVAAIPPDAVLASTERPAAMKDVELFGVEVHARRQILIPRLAGSMWIRLEMRPRPAPDIRRYCGIEHELNLGSMNPYFARIRHTEAEYGWKRRVDTRKLQLDWNVTGLPRFWHGSGGVERF